MDDSNGHAGSTHLVSAMEAPQIPFLADLSKEELDELDRLEPIEFAYPKESGQRVPTAGIVLQPGVPNIDLTDVLRTKVGNRLGPVPKAELNAMSPSELRALKNQRLEEAAGWAKPLAQFYNVLTSPAVGEGLLIGIPNALSKLANASMDEAAERLTGKPWDNDPAWQIPQDPLKRLNPLREGDIADAPADQFGYEFGAETAGEIAGAAVGATLIKNLKRVPQLVNLANKLKQQQQVKRLAVAAQTNNTLRRGINRARFGGEAFVDTTIASLFQDAEFGNVADLFAPNPLSTKEDNSYFENLRNKQIADGILTPLALIGAGQLTPWTRRLADGDLAFGLDELAEVELEPYVPRKITQPLLPPGAVDEGFDSAIDRSTSANLQVQQVQAQRERLNAMFPAIKAFEGGEGQFSLDITGAGGAFREDAAPLPRVEVQPEPVSEIRPGLADESAPAEAQTVVSGPEFEFRQREFLRTPKQMKLDLTSFEDAPDPRPELSTFLAELDELDDFQLQEMLPNVSPEEKLKARQAELEAVEAKIAKQRERIAEIEERVQLPEGTKRRMTIRGARRETDKAKQVIDQLQTDVVRLTTPKVEPMLVGDQLELAMSSRVNEGVGQMAIPGTDRTSVAGLKFMDLEWDEQLGRYTGANANLELPADVGYASADDYRNALMEYPRDLLREWLKPSQNPAVAAILKARTGRRVWSAKKADLVNALIEYAQRQGKYLPRAEQPELAYVNTTASDPALAGTPLEPFSQVDSTADLGTGALRTVEDADGAAAVVPDVPFPGGRGRPPMDEATRESIKQKILQAAMDNGEVQIDVTPIPDKLPATEFNQGQLLDVLFTADDDGQMMFRYANDEVPTYKAGGKSAEALLEEVRQRFDWAELDGAAQQANSEAMFQKNGWNQMTWEEKKRTGLLSSGFYVGEAGEVTDVTSDLLLEWTPDGVIPAADAAIAKPKDQPKKKRSKSKTSSQVTQARKNTEKLRKQLDEAKRQRDRSTCDG